MIRDMLRNIDVIDNVQRHSNTHLAPSTRKLEKLSFHMLVKYGIGIKMADY
jgi:hypothetical protein